MRGSAPARMDDKGRLKIPTLFRTDVQDRHGPDVFVTSVTGTSVRIYPMPAWLEVERKLSAMPANHPSRMKFLDRVSFYGQTSELDSQGRVLLLAPGSGALTTALRPGPGTDDTALVLDISDVKRLGQLADTVRTLNVPRVVIDHHIASDDRAGDIVLTDTTACATGAATC